MQAIHSLFMMDSFTAARLPRLAMLTCVRNEAKWLPAFLEYHHAIGVERAYVYCDRCTDGSEAIARSYPWVQVFRIDAEQVARFSYISDIHCACMSHSLALARQEGFDWLMILDADEFACGNNPGATALDRALLLPMLIDAKPETVQIRLLTREVVPMRVPAGTPFWQQRYFFSPRRGSPGTLSIHAMISTIAGPIFLATVKGSRLCVRARTCKVTILIAGFLIRR